MPYLNMSKDDALKSVGKGWALLIHGLYSQIPSTVRVLEVKEKFGTLRFYWEGHGELEEFEKLVEVAEAASHVMCEKCGAPGKRVTIPEGYWAKTWCYKCYAEAWCKAKVKEEMNGQAATPFSSV